MKIKFILSMAFILMVFATAGATAAENSDTQFAGNAPPVANAGNGKTVMTGTTVRLNGSRSVAPEGKGLLYRWTQTGGDPVILVGSNTPTPSFTAPQVGPEGADLEFSLVVTENIADHPKSSAPDHVVITVVSQVGPPNCDLASPSIASLWPPNHKLKKITIRNLVDHANDPYNIVILDITRVTQDEPIDGEADGHTGPDAIIHVADPFDSVSLRAERSDIGDGRVYVIHFEASDGFKSCKGSVSVEVPLDLNADQGEAVDSGQTVDATRP